MILRLFVFLGLILCTSCAPLRFLKKDLKNAESQFQDHIGFMVYDPEHDKTLVEYNASKYFIPASNTKIFSFFTGLKILGDSIPALKYIERGDSLIFWGTGDPSFLYAETPSSSNTYHFLASSNRTLFFSPVNFNTTHLGSGWAWSDYMYSYSVERSSLPLYGNFLTATWNGSDSIQSAPKYFNQFISHSKSEQKRSEILRDIDSNDITFSKGDSTYQRSWELPFRTTPQTIVQILTDTLHRPVQLIETPFDPSAKTIYSTPVDSLYRVMMQDSDNFIAEQLMLICSGQLNDTLSTDWMIEYMKKNHLLDLPDEPQWVDGSGLSRYNMFTPRTIIALWKKIYYLIEEERLFKLLAIGGEKGTIKDNYKGEVPYIFGKTGTLRNNHCLSGFIKTKKGNVLIFSFMNNHFTSPTNDIRELMEKVLLQVHDKY